MKTILLIDDDRDDQEIFSMALQEVAPDFRFITAGDGFEALEMLKERNVKPDYIFLDLNMPRMNGRQCLEEIRRDPELSEVPVVIYSTSSELKDREQLIEMGATAFVTKPPKIVELINIVRDIIYQLR
jgi:CheY-like chemotaxis protein